MILTSRPAVCSKALLNISEITTKINRRSAGATTRPAIARGERLWQRLIQDIARSGFCLKSERCETFAITDSVILSMYAETKREHLVRCCSFCWPGGQEKQVRMIESSAATTVQQARNIHNSLYFAVRNTKSWHGKNVEHWLRAIRKSHRGTDDPSGKS